jgi:hypothetical protein
LLSKGDEMNKLLAALNIFRKGQVVVNPTAWKNGQITGSVLAGFFAALIGGAKAFGYNLPVSDDQLLAIGSGIVAIGGLLINPAVTIASSDKVGLPASNTTNEQTISPITGH